MPSSGFCLTLNVSLARRWLPQHLWILAPVSRLCSAVVFALRLCSAPLLSVIKAYWYFVFSVCQVKDPEDPDSHHASLWIQHSDQMLVISRDTGSYVKRREHGFASRRYLTIWRHFFLLSQWRDIPSQRCSLISYSSQDSWQTPWTRVYYNSLGLEKHQMPWATAPQPSLWEADHPPDSRFSIFLKP